MNIESILLLGTSAYALVSLLFSKRSREFQVLMGVLYLLPMLAEFFKVNNLLTLENFSSFLLLFYCVLITVSHVRESKNDPCWRVEDLKLNDTETAQFKRCAKCEKEACFDSDGKRICPFSHLPG